MHCFETYSNSASVTRQGLAMPHALGQWKVGWGPLRRPLKKKSILFFIRRSQRVGNQCRDEHRDGGVCLPWPT